jgi:hypothetical protein
MNRPLTFFMLLKASPHWQALDRDARERYLDDLQSELMSSFPALRMRHFHAEFFHARCTDLLVWETDDMPQYYFALHHLRDSDFFARPYFDLVDVIPSVEDSWREHDWASGDLRPHVMPAHA